MNKLEIEKVLVLSTGHVSEKTASRLPNGIPGLIAYNKGDYGWLIYTNPDMLLEPEFGNELDTLILLAQANHCDWIMLDRDGRVMDFLPTFDW